MQEGSGLGQGRWTSPDRQSAFQRLRERREMGVKVVLDILGYPAQNALQAAGSFRAYSSLLLALQEENLKGSVAVKLSTLGAAFDADLCRDHIGRLCREGDARGAEVEIDMEGRGMVDFTVDAALRCAAEGLAPTVALQAYLDRSSDDLEILLQQGIRVRLVKGAYAGDTDDFFAIQRRFKDLAARLAEGGLRFCLGTQDPEIVAWAKEELARRKEVLEFGFLKGLSDRAKASLAREGWAVSEYVPFGGKGDAYVSRRLQYLSRLKALGRAPLD